MMLPPSQSVACEVVFEALRERPTTVPAWLRPHARPVEFGVPSSVPKSCITPKTSRL